MKFDITKKTLVNALSRMKEVATKGIKTDFMLAGRVTIQCKKDRVVFSTTNGHLDATMYADKEDDPVLGSKNTPNTPGIATVDAIVILGIANALGGDDADDHILSISLEESTLSLKDSTAGKRRKKASMEVLSVDHDIEMKPHKAPIYFPYEIETERFCNSLQKIAIYGSKIGYKVRYNMICLHFLPNSMRFVCGSGARFAVLSFDEKNTTKGVGKDGVKYLIPVDQAMIIAKVLDDSKKIVISYEDKQTCYLSNDNKMELKLGGIPKVEYIAYENNAFSVDNAQCIADIKSSDLREGSNLMGAVRDKTLEQEAIFHSCICSLEEGKDAFFDVPKDESKYGCEFDCPVNFYKGNRSSFKAEYPWQFISELCSSLDYVRLYCMDEHGILIAYIANLDDTQKENGMPKFKENADGSRLSFFFATVAKDK